MEMQILEQAYDAVKTTLSGANPVCGIVLGSGMSGFSERLSVRGEVDYSAIPGLGSPGIKGHAGRLVWAEHAGMELLVFCGRRHWYEGEGWEPIAIPPYILKRFGVVTVILTNAAGAVRSDLSAGDIMIIDDHINAIGTQPLAGPHLEFWGERFPDQSCVYDQSLRAMIDSVAADLNIRVSHGTYAATPGPAYETPAEVRSFRILGADAIGMSTVPEAMLASAAGLRVAGLSCITNTAGGHETGAVSHDAVLAASNAAAENIAALLLGLLERLDGDTSA